MKLRQQILILVLVAAMFAGFNYSMYQLLTRRLSNNFSDVSQAQMIDVGSYLPHEEDSDLARVDASLRLAGDLPKLDGAAALVPVYASVIDNIYPEGCVTFDGGSFSSDNYYGENFAPDSAMQYKNTVRGYQAIVDGDTDIFFSAAPSEAQRQYAADQGVELVYVPVGLEAFVFFVNGNNPVENLTAGQIRQIYAGQITNWADVGGVNRVINPVTRLAGSGSQTTMEAFMGDHAFGPKSLLAITGGSLGYSFRCYMDGIVDNQKVKLISLNVVYPSPEHIRNGTYPVIVRFYAIYRADNDNENIPVLIDWLLSEEGQQIIQGCGYVRLQ